MTLRDTSSVFHIDILDDDIRAERDQALPWVFETNQDQNCFATEEEAREAQRGYRIKHGFDPITGDRNRMARNSGRFYIA